MDFEMFKPYIGQWPFLVISLAIGMVVQVIKKNLLTEKLAFGNKIVFVLRGLLPLFGIVLGCAFGAVDIAVMDEHLKGTGVDGNGQVLLYYMGAGLMSTFVFQVVKRFAKSKGVESPFMLGGELDEDK